jgi:hypothetical protein
MPHNINRPSSRRALAIERLADLAQAAVMFDPDITKPADFDALRRASGPALALVTFGNPLDLTANAAEQFISSEEQRVLDSPPQNGLPSDPDFDKGVASDQAHFYLGVAIGLLLAERV